MCKQAHAEACPILYMNTTFKASLTSDPKEIWRIVGVHNGGIIRQVGMHVDGHEDCVLYQCKPIYSPDLELLSIRITSHRWLGNDVDAQERLRRLHALFRTKILEAACSKTRPQIIEDCHDGEVCFEVNFSIHKNQASVSDRSSRLVLGCD